MTSFSSMSLYALTVKQPSATLDAIAGDFMQTGKQQILTANGSRLTILEVKRDQITEVFSQDTFSILRRVAKFRLAGGTKDLIAITTDSGRLVTYEYLPDQRKFETVHFETFGKSGVRRVVPGEYLAADPKGRALMVASPEKNKLVYILTRSGQTDISISSPLEAHKPMTLVYCLIGLDVGYDNPMFAAIELDFSSAENDPSGEAYHELKKELVYYELDLGLNHIVRKWSEPIDRTAHTLFRVPGGADAPSGVLVCGEDNITYRRIFNDRSDVHRLAIPRREGPGDDLNRKRMIVSGALHTLKGGSFFYLLQTDDGDLFKVTMDAPNGRVERLRIKYFDTIPLSTSICVLRSGLVFCACESGDRIVYDIESLGEDTDDPYFESDQFPVDPEAKFPIPCFTPRPLVNLNSVQTIPSLHPIMDMEVANPALEDAPQIYTVSGSGGRSTFRTTRNALEVLDLIDSPLPQDASRVWTSKLAVDDEKDGLIILCLHSVTLIMRIGQDVDQAENTGFLTDTNTIGVQQFGQDGVLQIHPKGIRNIQGITFPDEEDPTARYRGWTDWSPPAHRTIVACATNNRQVAIALSSGQILYFECDTDGSLSMSDQEITLDCTINCLAMPEVPEGNLRAFFMAVGCSDQTVRIYNISPDMEGNILGSISVQGLTAPPSDLIINHMVDNTPRGYSQYLHIGLRSGVYIRSVLDEMTGDIEDPRRRFLGHEPITFAKINAANEPAVLAMTSRPWLSYTHPRTGALQMTPLNYIPFKSAWSFDGPQFQGIIVVSASELRIFTFNNLINNTSYETIPLNYTPRKLVGNHELGLFYVIQSENDTFSAEKRKNFIDDWKKKKIEGGDMDLDQTNGETADDDSDSNALPPKDFGYPRAEGQWASCIQVVDPVSEKAVVYSVELNNNQCLVSAALVYFESRPDEAFLAVGTATNLRFMPYQFSAASIQVYQVSQNGRELKLYHETEVADPPQALIPFKGKLMAGIGRELCLYDIGMRSLLRKAMAPNCVPTRIVDIKTQGSRLVVSDAKESVTFVVHKDQVHPNRLIPFIDDTVKRHTTCSEMLDYETTVGGDKFGNLWLVRCPSKVSEVSDESPDGSDLMQDKNYLGGTPNRLDLIAHYFTNDMPVRIQRTNLLHGGERVIFWAGLQGTLGALIPFTSRRTHKMFQQLELQIRTDDKPISGRDHLAFRSYYNPAKSVIDGDLIERYLVLSRDQRESIAAQLPGDWRPDTVDEAIWTMRALFAF